jgi:hypothetical protein
VCVVGVVFKRNNTGMQRYGRTGTSIADGSLQCHSSEFAAFVGCANEMDHGQIATLCVLAVLVTLTIDLEALPSLVFVCLLLHHYSNTPSSLIVSVLPSQTNAIINNQ